jgi:hypothetical protein
MQAQIQFAEGIPTLMPLGQMYTLVNVPLNEHTAHAAMIHFSPDTDRRASQQNRMDITAPAALLSIAFKGREYFMNSFGSSDKARAVSTVTR